jgi:hypothetical protein
LAQKQDALPTGAAGQFLVKDGTNANNFMDLKISPPYLKANTVGVGSGFDYLNSYDNFTYDGLKLRINRGGDTTRFVELGMIFGTNNAILRMSGGRLDIDANIRFTQFTNSSVERMLAVDVNGNLVTRAIPGGSGGAVNLQNMHIAFGGPDNLMTSSSNFMYSNNGLYHNEGNNFLFMGRSLSNAEVQSWNIAAVGSRRLDISSIETLLRGDQVRIGAEGVNSVSNDKTNLIHIGRPDLDNTHAVIINGTRFNMMLENSQWGDAKNQSTPQAGDKVIFNVENVGGVMTFRLQKINKKLTQNLSQSDTVLIL